MLSATSRTIVSTESVEEAGDSFWKPKDCSMLAYSSTVDVETLGSGLLVEGAAPEFTDSTGSAPDAMGPSGK